jgi:hypothetical protein
MILLALYLFRSNLKFNYIKIYLHCPFLASLFEKGI